MNITLEMVDNVIERTGCTYKQAKAALEANEGDVLKAIVELEEQMKGQTEEEPQVEQEANDGVNEIIAKLKELVNLGIVNKIIFEKDGKDYLNVPVMAGAVSAVVFAFPTVTAIIAAVALGCEIKIEKEDGTVMNLNEMTKGAVNNLKTKVQEKTQAQAPVEPSVDPDHEEVQAEEVEEAIIVEEADLVEDDEIVVEAKDIE